MAPLLDRMATGFRALVWGVGVAYPVLLYWALVRHGAWAGALVGGASALLWGVRAALTPRGSASLWALPVVVLVLSGLSLLTEDSRLLLALPVFINLALLAVFGASLWSEQTYVERIARLQEPELSPAQVSHCRQFTRIWVAFFCVNGAITAGLALGGEMVAWTLYTSVFSYVLIALLLVAEWVVRRRRFGARGRSAGELEP